MTSVPVSVMAADVEHESLWVILKIISAKTKALAACEDFLEMRGIYRSGLLGKGVAGMLDLHDPGISVRKRWLILTKGVGFAPAVNLIRWAAGRVDIHVIADPEKVGDDVIRQQFRAWQPEAHRNEGGRFRLEFQSLAKLLEQPAAASPLQQTDSIATALHTSGSIAAAPPATALHTSDSHDPDLNAPCLQQTDYDRIFLLASDYYIKRLSAVMKIPPEKLVFSAITFICAAEKGSAAPAVMWTLREISAKCVNAGNFLPWIFYFPSKMEATKQTACASNARLSEIKNLNLPLTFSFLRNIIPPRTISKIQTDD